MKCPNDGTEMIEFGSPLMVPPTEDATEDLDEQGGFSKTLVSRRYYQFIDRACPKCGYHETRSVTAEEWVKKKA